MSAIATKVLNRGIPPASFVSTIVAWAKTADPDIFAPNPNPRDIYSTIADVLGNPKPAPRWAGIDRRAVMLEVMRVHAGFESSWDWTEGVDVTNHSSVAHIEGEETGIFQVSFDSTYLGGGAMKQFTIEHGIDTPRKFINGMKADHNLALKYYARLIRVSVQWAGPIKRHEIDAWVKRDAVKEFEALLS